MKTNYIISNPDFSWIKDDAEGDEVYYYKIINAYLSNFIEFSEIWTSAVSKPDVDAFSLVKHKLKPALMQMGLNDFLEKVEWVQVYLASAPLPQKESSELLTELNNYIQFLNEELSKQGQKPKA